MLPRVNTLRQSQRARASAPTSATYDDDNNVRMSEREFLLLTRNQRKSRLPKLVYEGPTKPPPCAPEAAMRNAVEAEIQIQAMGAYTRKVNSEWEDVIKQPAAQVVDQADFDRQYVRWNEQYKVEEVNGWIQEAKTISVAYPFPSVIEKSQLFAAIVSDIVDIIDARYKNLAFNLVPNLKQKFGMLVTGYVRLICNEPYHERELEPEFGEQLQNLKKLLLEELEPSLSAPA